MRVYGLMLIGLALLGGCTPETRQHARAEAACRAAADKVDNRLNRADMATRDTSTTPLSAEGMPGFNTQPLIERSVHDDNVSNCMSSHSDTSAP